jgi:hypothetical protein
MVEAAVVVDAGWEELVACAGVLTLAGVLVGVLVASEGVAGEFAAELCVAETLVVALLGPHAASSKAEAPTNVRRAMRKARQGSTGMP